LAPANRQAGIDPQECEISENEAHGGLELLRGILGDTKRRIVRRRLAHLTVAAGMAEAIEVQTPDVEAGVIQRIAPGLAVEAMRDRQRGGKRRAMHIEHGAAGALLASRRQKAQEQRQIRARSANAKMLFAWIEFLGV
jgi:hypothetical protein